MAWEDDRVVGQRRECPEAPEEQGRIAARQVRPSAPVEEERVAGDQPAVDQEALAAGGMARGVDEGHVDVADGDHVAGTVRHQIGRSETRGPGDPVHLVHVHVDRRTGELDESGRPVDCVPHHRTSDVVRVVVRREEPDHAHALGFDEADDPVDVVRGIHEEALASVRVPDGVDVVRHLAGNAVVDAEVATREPLAEPHAVVEHRRRLPPYAVAVAVASVVVDGRLVPVPDDWREGDFVVGVPPDRALVIPAAAVARAADAVSMARAALGPLGAARTEALAEFYREFASVLADDRRFAPVARANEADVESASARGRATGRLRLDARMRGAMIKALDAWVRHEPASDSLIERTDHAGWSVEVRRAPLGVVGFVFEGRPNVFTDATGVLLGRNTCVFRIGSDALGTARALMECAVQPSLEKVGIPINSVVLLDDPTHAAALALMAQRGLGLAVARGSGPTVRDLGAVARQHGVPASLHGTGGAWLIACDDADPARVRSAVEHSLDRKVCNTLNVVCLAGTGAAGLAREVAAGAVAAARARGTTPIVHLVDGVDDSSFEGCEVRRATEPVLATEWEWDDRPEFTVVWLGDLEGAIEACNRWSPHFVVSVLTAREDRFLEGWEGLDAPFVGDGMTRWVDGQYALGRPELGLSNWEHGRLLGRGAILSGTDVFSVRYRVRQSDLDVRR